MRNIGDKVPKLLLFHNGGGPVKHFFVRVSFLVAAILFMGAGKASADTLTYQFTGAVTATFELPSMPTVLVSDPGFGFEVVPMNLMINGVASNDFLTFYNIAFGGGFGACFAGNCLDVLTSGPQLYSGSEDHPTMLAMGSTPLIDRRTGDPAGSISTATPEPSAFLLLAIGLFAVLGAGLVSKRFARVPVAA
jgi:hypothetical protein